MTEKYPSYYDSYEQFVEAKEADAKLRKEIQDSLIEHAPTEEIRQALINSIGREES